MSPSKGVALREQLTPSHHLTAPLDPPKPILDDSKATLPTYMDLRLSRMVDMWLGGGPCPCEHFWAVCVGLHGFTHLDSLECLGTQLRQFKGASKDLGISRYAPGWLNEAGMVWENNTLFMYIGGEGRV